MFKKHFMKHMNAYMLILLAQSNTMGIMVNGRHFGPFFTPRPVAAEYVWAVPDLLSDNAGGQS